MTTHSTVTTAKTGSLKTSEKKPVSLIKGLFTSFMLLAIAGMAMSFTQEDTSRLIAIGNTTDATNCCSGFIMAKASQESIISMHKTQLAENILPADAPVKTMVISNESIRRADNAMDLRFREKAVSQRLAADYLQQMQQELNIADLAINDDFNKWTLAPGFSRMIQADAVKADNGMDMIINMKAIRLNFNKALLSDASQADQFMDRNMLISQFGVLNFDLIKNADLQMDAMMQRLTGQ